MAERKADYRYSFMKIFNIVKFVTVVSLPIVIYDYVSTDTNLIGALVHLFILPYIQQGYMWVLWYMGALCLLYAVLPIINRTLNSNNKLVSALLVMIIVETFIFALNQRIHFEQGIIQTFRVWNFLAYFLLGVLVRKINMPRLEFWVVAIAGCSYVGFNKLIGGMGVEYFFSSPICMIYAITLFLWVKNLEIKDNHIIEILSKLFLPVYCLHVMVMNFLCEQIGYNWGGGVGPVVNCALVATITIGISYVIMRIPFFNKVFRI